MKEILYDWVRNLVFYQILTSIIINMIPANVYEKYIRFFLGMLFIIIAMQPVLKTFRLADTLDVGYVHQMLEQEFQENKEEWIVGQEEN